MSHSQELYHELHALDRFQQDYQHKLEEVDSLHLPRKGLWCFTSEETYFCSKFLLTYLNSSVSSLSCSSAVCIVFIHQKSTLNLVCGHMIFATTGESLSIMLSELKHQRKLVRSLQKKSLWSKSLEQVYTKPLYCSPLMLAWSFSLFDCEENWLEDNFIKGDGKLFSSPKWDENKGNQ